MRVCTAPDHACASPRHLTTTSCTAGDLQQALDLARMHVVTPAWASTSLRTSSLRPEALFPAADFKAALLSALSPCTGDPSSHPRGTPSPPPAATGAAPRPPEAPVDTAHACGGPPPVRAQGAASVATGAAAAADDPAAPAATIPGWGLSSWGPPGWTSAEWGVGGVWLEPFEARAAQDTLQTLFSHYNRQAAPPQDPAGGSPVGLSGSRAAGAPRTLAHMHGLHAWGGCASALCGVNPRGCGVGETST